MIKQFHTYVRYENSKVGVMVARALDDKTFGINVSLVHPDLDTFDKNMSIILAVGKLVNFHPLPRICINPNNTKRARAIHFQFHKFVQRAYKVFKDKEYKYCV